jgi:ATP-dependent Clp protease ATP-binding subunit ClpA
MLVEILCRRSKPNVIIIGEPGVGKTALVEGFAIEITKGNVPEMLKNGTF